MPSAQDLSELEALQEWLLAIGNEKKRRASRVIQAVVLQGGRDRSEHRPRQKNRASQQISAILTQRTSQNSESAEIRLLHHTHEISDVSATITEDAGERDCLNSWIADGAGKSGLKTSCPKG